MIQPEDRNGVLAGGNWIIDHVKIIDTFPAQDTLASIFSESQGTGGSPYNILINLSKLGVTFPLQGVGLVGDDPDGRAIFEDCRTFGIDSSQIRTTDQSSTSYTDVMTVQSTGRRTFFHQRGANSQLSESHFDLESSDARIFHLGYFLLLDTLDEVASDGTTGAARLLRRAIEAGMKTSIDLVSEDSDRFASVVVPALPYVDYLIINEIEAERTTGIRTTIDGQTDFAGIARAAARLFELGVRQWVIIHAAEGALAISHSGEQALQGSVQVPTDRIVGSAGAGDAFAAGALYGLHEGWDIQSCMKIAVTCAATNLFDPTCTGGIRPAQDCLALGQELGFRDCQSE